MPTVSSHGASRIEPEHGADRRARLAAIGRAERRGLEKRRSGASRSGACEQRRTHSASAGIRLEGSRSARRIASALGAWPMAHGAARLLRGVGRLGDDIGDAELRRDRRAEPVRRLVIEVIGEPEVRPRRAVLDAAEIARRELAADVAQPRLPPRGRRHRGC